MSSPSSFHKRILIYTISRGHMPAALFQEVNGHIHLEGTAMLPLDLRDWLYRDCCPRDEPTRPAMEAEAFPRFLGAFSPPTTQSLHKAERQ